MSDITIIGIDLAKRVFQLCGLSRTFKVQFNKSIKRDQLVIPARVSVVIIAAKPKYARSKVSMIIFSV